MNCWWRTKGTGSLGSQQRSECLSHVSRSHTSVSKAHPTASPAPRWELGEDSPSCQTDKLAGGDAGAQHAHMCMVKWKHLAEEGNVWVEEEANPALADTQFTFEGRPQTNKISLLTRGNDNLRKSAPSLGTLTLPCVLSRALIR